MSRASKAPRKRTRTVTKVVQPPVVQPPVETETLPAGLLPQVTGLGASEVRALILPRALQTLLRAKALEYLPVCLGILDGTARQVDYKYDKDAGWVSIERGPSIEERRRAWTDLATLGLHRIDTMDKDAPQNGVVLIPVIPG